MTQAGGADRPGPAPKPAGHEGNPKARSGAASPQGFTVRCFWVAARDWRRRAHRQTKGGSAVSGRDQTPASPRCQNWPLSRCSAPTCKAVNMSSLSATAVMPLRSLARARKGRSDRLAFHPRSPGSGHHVASRRHGGHAIARTPAREGKPSAPAASKALRDEVFAGIDPAHRDSRQRPPVGIGSLALDQHPAPRQEAHERDPGGLSGPVVATQA